MRRRVGIVWGLLVLNAIAFSPGFPLVVPIPHRIGQVITQGALPVALIVALTVNRRVIVRPNVFLCLVTLLVLEALVTTLQPEHPRYRIPDLPARGVRRRALAAIAMVGATRSAAGPQPPGLLSVLLGSVFLAS